MKDHNGGQNPSHTPGQSCVVQGGAESSKRYDRDTDRVALAGHDRILKVSNERPHTEAADEIVVD